MNKPTYEESMLKWILISHDMEKDRGHENCPLCQYYDTGYEYDDEGYDESLFNNCLRGDEVCPINKFNNDNCCSNTPYDNYKPR